MGRTLLAAMFLSLVILAGCHSAPKPAAQPQSGDTSNYKVYKLRGKVVSTNPKTGEVEIDGEDIPGFMEAMSMDYKLKDPSIMSELHPGDKITADLLVPQGSDAAIVLDHIVIVAQAKPDYEPTVIYHVPAPGDLVPDFELRNQDGREIHLDQFRGKSLLITFIYTRCPFPNFCPLVTHNFAEIDKQLAAKPGLYAKTHLLSVSIDPDNDTPARLRAYGTAYIGSSSKSAFAHWDFAAPSKSALDEMARYFDVGVTRDGQDSITHTLSTTLIGPNGKVVGYYPGNEWTPAQVEADVEHVASAAS
jgi:protein SCO1/2